MEDGKVMLPWSRSCFVCGEENERGMKARSYLCGDRVELPFTAPKAFCGWATVVHGGLVATVLDEVMTWAAIVGSRKPCFAAEIRIRMKRPLEPGTRCAARATMVQNRQRLFLTEGRLEGEDGTVYAEGTGTYMAVPPDRLEEFRHDFVSRPGCHDIDDILGI